MFVLLFVNRKMHSGMKTYGCELCGKSFLDSLRLRMHLLSHSGKEIIPTQKPQCHSIISVEKAVPPVITAGFILGYSEWLTGISMIEHSLLLFSQLQWSIIRQSAFLRVSFTTNITITVKEERYESNFREQWSFETLLKSMMKSLTVTGQ